MAPPGRPPRHTALKQERSRATRQRLIDAAVELIRTQGYEATKASEIAARAGVSEGTFFFHFPRKGDLLVALGLRTSGRLVQDGALREDETVADALDRVVRSVSRSIQRSPRELVVSTIIEMYRRSDEWPSMRAGNTDFQRIFRGIYEAAVERGDLPASVDIDEITTMLSAVLLHAILMWAQGQRGDRPLQSLLGDRVAVIHAGVVATASGKS